MDSCPALRSFAARSWSRRLSSWPAPRRSLSRGWTRRRSGRASRRCRRYPIREGSEQQVRRRPGRRRARPRVVPREGPGRRGCATGRCAGCLVV